MKNSLKDKEEMYKERMDRGRKTGRTKVRLMNEGQRRDRQRRDRKRKDA